MKNKLSYRKAEREDTETIFELVQNTIKTVYPKYYPREVVDFFCELHSKEKIEEDVQSGVVGVLMVDNVPVGTGSYQDNHITRVYVHPEFQGRGYGSSIMDKLEQEIVLKYDKVYLDASLPASHLYEKRGYTTIKHERWNVENDVVLVYEIMEKSLCKTNAPSNIQHEVRVGKCHSVPEILENGKIELSEEWQWLNGDMSKGSSVIVEQ